MSWYCEVLEKLGRIIEEYFDDITPKGDSFNLLVDEFLFEYFMEQMDTSTERYSPFVYDALKLFKCDSNNNPHVALAIAAYQVAVFYKLDPSASGDDYNSKLFSSNAYKGLTYQEYWYQNTAPYAPQEGEAFQDKLWALLEQSFKIKDIPAPKPYKAMDRYVQYPKSQNVLGHSMRTFRIEYADTFIKLNLEPNQGITYELFEKLVFDGRQNEPDELIRRLVFSFYTMWDGRSFKEIENHERISSKERMQKAKDECFIQIDPTPVVKINGLTVDLRQGRIPDHYLWHFSETSGMITHKGLCFIEDEEGYDDWLPTHRCIDPDEPVLILTDVTKLPAHIRDAIKQGEVQKIPAGRYIILVLEFKSRRGFLSLDIPIKQEPVFKLAGGLRVNGNTYYDFALPAVQLTEGQDKAKYKHVFIDSKKYPLSDGFFKIPEADVFSEGEHVVKLTDSWNSSKLCFKIKKARDADIPAEHGWELDYEGKTCAPSRLAPETVIDGLRMLTKLDWIERKKAAVSGISTSSTDLRNFEEQQERLLFRFEHTGNMAISQRRKYGN